MGKFSNPMSITYGKNEKNAELIRSVFRKEVNIMEMDKPEVPMEEQFVNYQPEQIIQEKLMQDQIVLEQPDQMNLEINYTGIIYQGA